MSNDQAIDDFANPAWWRGEKYGTQTIIDLVNGILDGKHREGVFNAPGLDELRARLIALDTERMTTLHYLVEINDDVDIYEDDEGAARVRFEIEKTAAANSNDKVVLYQFLVTELDSNE